MESREPSPEALENLRRIESACVTCGHSKEQHEGHTYQPGQQPIPTHCSAGCGCPAYSPVVEGGDGAK